MKAIMYHYVRPYDASVPHLKHLELEDFEKQLAYFGNEFGFVSQAAFKQALHSGVVPQGVVLTFDDALKCHYSHVFPVLKALGLWGIFYVPTGMYESRNLLEVHRIHLLLGMVDSSRINEQLSGLVTPAMLTDFGHEGFRHNTYIFQNNDEASLTVKRTLNYFISYEYRAQVIDELIRMNNLTEVADTEKFYITPNEMREMRDGGMLIGSHTVNHPVLSKLPDASQQEEITRSFAFLESELGIPDMKTFCYPYGGFHSFTDTTETLLTQAGCDFSFNVEPREVTAQDLRDRPQALPRFDCNQFPYGKVRTR